MAKALFGHMATNEAVLAAEIRRLRAQVAGLETQVTDLQSQLAIEQTLSLPQMEESLREPVLG